jgi:ribulose 1,5-bisphosphate synthetase/thiazole synthase
MNDTPPADQVKVTDGFDSDAQAPGISRPMKREQTYDVIVVGAGHAGVEAARF